MMDFKDEYVRDYSFDPELLLGRKDSIKVQKKIYQKKKLGKKPKRRKLLTIPLSLSNFNRNSSNSTFDKTEVDDEEEEDEFGRDRPQKQIDSKIEGFYHVS